jgi:hypothetical protein
LARQALLISTLLLLLCSGALGAQPRGTTAVGVRVGLFDNSHNDLEVVNSDVKLFASRTVFYIEGYVDYYLLDYLAFCANVGSYSKGDIRFDVYYNGVFDGSFIGQASVYPMQVGLRLTPFRDQLPLQCRPYVEGGGALIVGRETASMGTYGSTFGTYTDGTIGSETDFNWWAGIGSEIPMSPTIQLDFMVKYLKTQFSGDIAGIKDFSGVQISIGIGYAKPHKRK